jgi:hypothetical protein
MSLSVPLPPEQTDMNATRHVSKLMTDKVPHRDLSQRDADELRSNAYYVHLDGRSKRARDLEKRAREIERIVSREDARRLADRAIAKARLSVRNARPPS